MLYCLFAGLFQIIGTILLVSLFSHRNFAVSTAYTKTEAIQVAIFGAIFFQAYLNILSSIAVVLGMLGVSLVSEMCTTQYKFRQFLLLNLIWLCDLHLRLCIFGVKFFSLSCNVRPLSIFLLRLTTFCNILKLFYREKQYFKVLTFAL